MTEKGQFRLHDISKKGGRRSLGSTLDTVKKTTNRNLHEGIVRDNDQTQHSDTQKLTAAERARLLSDLDAKRGDFASNYFVDRDKIKGYADDDRAWAVAVEERIKDTTNDRMDWAANNIAQRLQLMGDAYARVAGSSHNCYAQHAMAAAIRDGYNQRGAIFAELDAKGIQLETQARELAFREGAVARLDSNDKEFQQINGEWNTLKDALTTHDAKQLIHETTARDLAETISENTIAFKLAITVEGWAEDTADASGSYASKADEFYAANVGASPF